ANRSPKSRDRMTREIIDCAKFAMEKLQSGDAVIEGVSKAHIGQVVMASPHVPKQRSSTSRIHCSKVIVGLILSGESSLRVRRVIQLKGVAFDHDGEWGDQEVT